MPTTPYASLLASVAAGAPTHGGLTATAGQTVQLSGESTVGWTQQLFELYSYPAGFAAPAGWSTDGAGVYFYSTTSTPPLITMSAATTPAKYLFRLTVNNGLNGSGVADATLVDEATAVRVAGAGGLHAFAPGETSQWSTPKKWAGDLQADIVTLDSAVAALPAAAAPTVTVKSEATAAGAGVAATILRTDAQIQAATAVPSVQVISDASTFDQGVASTLLRSDARLIATTAIPVTTVQTDAGVAAQGVATTLLRSDAQLLAVTAAPVSVGAANAIGVSTSLSRANHVHDHGAQTVDTQHALVVAGVSHGFIDKADKTKLDGITAGAAVASVSGTAPIASSGGATPAISITAASGADPGSMSAAHYTLVDGATATATASRIAKWDASKYIQAAKFNGEGTVSTAGVVNTVKAVTQLAARNNGDTQDINLVTTDAADKVTIGDVADAAAVDVATSGPTRVLSGAFVAAHATEKGTSFGMAPSFGGGEGVVGLANSTTSPSTAPTGGVVVESVAGVVKVWTPGKVRTTLAPEIAAAATFLELPRLLAKTHTTDATITAALVTVALPTASSFSMTVKVSAQVTGTDTRAHYKRLIRGGRGGAGASTIDDAATIGVDFDAIGVAAVPTIASDGAVSITIKVTGKLATEIDWWIMVDDCVIFSV